MTNLKLMKTFAAISALSAATIMMAPMAQADDGKAELGAVIGGVTGAYIGGEVDNKGSKKEGQIAGAVIGGSLGYIVGSNAEEDERYRRTYANQPGEYYKHNGQAYRRYKDSRHGYVSVRIDDNDPYYETDGRRRSHPVHSEHPGKGQKKFK